MIDVRPFASLGAANHGWLDARHHFSFASYHDEARMGWGAIRVWNDDRIGAHSGFAPHPHRDMEIITYVRTGAITHEDSMGNRGRTEAGDVQVMSAGTGIRHSEWNHEDEDTTLFQIWVLPDEANATPQWGARPFPRGERAGQFVTLASGMGDDGALPIQASARVMGATLNAGTGTTIALDPARVAYLVPAAGRIRLSGTRADGTAIDEVTANARDGVAIRDLATLTVTAEPDADAEIVLVEARA